MIDDIIEVIVKIFDPLIEAVEEAPNGVYYFLDDAGVIDDYDELSSNVQTLISSIQDMHEAVQQLANLLLNGNAFSAEGRQHLSRLQRAIETMDELGPISSGEVQLEDAGRRIINYLFIDYLLREQQDIYTFLQFIDAIAEQEGPVPYQIFDIEILFQFISDPPAWFRSQYGWGSPQFDSNKFMLRIRQFLGAVFTLPYFKAVRRSENEDYVQLCIPFFVFEQGGEKLESGLTLTPGFDHPTAPPRGLTMQLYGFAGTQDQFELGDLIVRYRLSANANVGIVEIFPDRTAVDDDPSGQLEANVYLGTKTSGPPKILLGEADGSRLEVQSFGVRLFALIGAKTDYAIELLSKGGKFVINPGQGDGLIQKLLPSYDLNINFDPSIGWSPVNGVFFNLSSGLETVIPLHNKIGPIHLKDLLFKLQLETSGVSSLNTSIAFSANLGPVHLNLSRVGIGMPFEFKKGGNLGFIDLEPPKFLSPETIGASLDTGLVSGGGFLSFEPEKHRYAGMLSLNMMALDVLGIALISTRLPNGEKGFSMLVSISAVFFPPFQLSFGFTLAAVGGLIGINRTMKVQALRDRLATGAMNSIMFPEDPIENADRIISDLRAVFPPKDDHFLVGPFLRIGFGTPSIIEVDLGVILEFPFTGRIVLLGSLGIYLPVKDIAIVEIHVDVVGDLNFPESYIRLDGRLRQSHVIGIPLKGGFAFLINWGNRPAFLFSIGGFHPQYKKPAQFPEIPRLQAIIRLGSVVVLSASYYQAITSNSFQVGFNAFLKAKALGASLEGRYGFNALFQFNPLFFSVDQGMSVKIKYKGKTLAGIGFFFRLSGPSPWNASGYAEISILFITLKIRFSITWGDRIPQPKTYESIDGLLDKVQQSLETESNWAAKLPPNFTTAESLRPVEELDEEGVILHPSGYLELRQNVLPFDTRIEKFGNSYVREKPRFRFRPSVRIGNMLTQTSNQQLVKDTFARGQFESLSNAQKLSLPDFDEFTAGLSYAEGLGQDFDLGPQADMRSVDLNQPENVIIKAEQETLRGVVIARPNPITERLILNRNLRRLATGLTGGFFSGTISSPPPPATIERQYMLASVADLTPLQSFNNQPLTFQSPSEARVYLQDNLSADQDLYQVLASYQFESPGSSPNLRLMDGFRRPQQAQLLACDTLSPLSQELINFPLTIPAGNSPVDTCWLVPTEDLESDIALSSGNPLSMSKLVRLKAGRTPDGTSKTIQVDYTSMDNGNDHFQLRSEAGLSVVDLKVRYQLPNGEFFDLRNYEGVQLNIKHTTSTLGLYFYMYDYRNRYWSNIIDNRIVQVDPSQQQQTVRFKFAELAAAHEHELNDPKMDHIKVLMLMVITKGEANDFAFESLQLF